MKTIDWRKAPLAAAMWRGTGKTWMRSPTAADLGNRENYMQMVDGEVISFAGGTPDGLSNDLPSAWWMTLVHGIENIKREHYAS